MALGLLHKPVASLRLWPLGASHPMEVLVFSWSITTFMSPTHELTSSSCTFLNCRWLVLLLLFLVRCSSSSSSWASCMLPCSPLPRPLPLQPRPRHQVICLNGSLLPSASVAPAHAWATSRVMKPRSTPSPRRLPSTIFFPSCPLL